MSVTEVKSNGQEQIADNPTSKLNYPRLVWEKPNILSTSPPNFTSIDELMEWLNLKIDTLRDGIWPETPVMKDYPNTIYQGVTFIACPLQGFTLQEMVDSEGKGQSLILAQKGIFILPHLANKGLAFPLSEGKPVKDLTALYAIIAPKELFNKILEQILR